MCTTIVFTGEDIGRYHGSHTVCTTIGFTTIVFPTIVFTGEVIGRYYGSHTVFTTIVFTKIVCTRIVFTWEVIGLVGRLTTGFTSQQTLAGLPVLYLECTKHGYHVLVIIAV